MERNCNWYYAIVKHEGSDLWSHLADSMSYVVVNGAIVDYHTIVHSKPITLTKIVMRSEYVPVKQVLAEENAKG